MSDRVEKILLGHGSGGRLMHQLIREYLVPEFDLKELNDSAVIRGHEFGASDAEFRLAFTTDSYVVSPIFFPGGNIGKLAVNGTVNDLAMVGARPLYLSAGLIIEEGFPMSDLKAVLSSMSEAAEKAGVKIIAGDIKVVDKGKGDGIFINTSGVGAVPAGVDLSAKNIMPSDKVIVSGHIGNHGIAVLSERNGLSFATPLLSDTVALNSLVESMLNFTQDIRMLRDPTRGGIATTLKEMAVDSGLCLVIHENLLPISSDIIGACELLGLDPLYVANEGILLAIVPSDVSEPLIEKMREHPYGKKAAIIGEVIDRGPKTGGMVLLRTNIGGTRIIDMLTGEQLPRIC